jgi:hypothetical protein
MSEDQAHRLMSTIAAGSGGALWVMARVFATVFAPSAPVSNREVRRAVVEAVFAMVAALIGGAFIAPAIVDYYAIKDPTRIGLVALVVGMGMWQSIPLLSAVFPRLLSLRLKMLNGGQK